MVLNSLTDFCLMEEKNKYITVSTYGAHWIDYIKGNETSLKN